MIAALGLAVAEWVAAMWSLLLLVAAVVAYGAGMFEWGRRRERFARGRAEVLSAVEWAVAETVVIPRPRQEAGR